MSIFKSEKFIPVRADDLQPVVSEVATHFKQRDYKVEFVQLAENEWEIGITRGGMFKAALGLKSALKVRLTTEQKGTRVQAGAGIFGKQAVPTALTMIVAWPVIFAQVWGLIRESGLDDEAIRMVELNLSRMQRMTESRTARLPHEVGGEPVERSAGPPTADPWEAASGTNAARDMRRVDGLARTGMPTRYCTGCGRELEGEEKYCPQCGELV